MDGGLCVNRYRRCLSSSGSLCHGGLNMAMEPDQACFECHEALAELISIVCEWYECHGVRTCANCMRAMTCWLDLYRLSIRILTCNSLTNMRAFTHTHTHAHTRTHTWTGTHTYTTVFDAERQENAAIHAAAIMPLYTCSGIRAAMHEAATVPL